MKKNLFITTLIICFFCIYMVGTTSYTVAAETSETITFGWEQSDFELVKEWIMEWSDTAGGPYSEVGKIPKESGGPSFQAPLSATVTGTPATNVKKYFVLLACGDMLQSDNTIKYACSEPSNEVNYDFWIPQNEFKVPVDFKIVAE